MKSAKERKMDRKRKHKELGAARTAKSRQRRLDNKAKREAIHKIDPNLNIKIINQKTYVNDIEVNVKNGRLVMENAVEMMKSVIPDEVDVVKEIKTSNKNALYRLANKLRITK